MKQITSGFITIFFLLFGFTGGYVLAQSPVAPVHVFNLVGATSNVDAEELIPLQEVWNLLHSRYYEQPLDNTLLAEGAINGMLAVLEDPHTRYLSPEDEAAARRSMAGEFQGIGAEVESVDGAITIVTPIDGSPAEAAGLQPGDILREADGVALTGMDISQAAALVRGPAGTTVRLLIERAGETFEIEIVRDVIKLPSVRAEMLDEQILYVRLSRFAHETGRELDNLLKEYLPQNPGGLILDLRRNPGGSLDSTVQVADIFLPEGVVLVERFGDGQEKIFETTSRGAAKEIPLVVLIDEGSASASELLAGAIKDRDRGVLIGQTTFGKGTVQTWEQLSNGGGVRITIAQWLTPAGTWIHENGLDPHYFVLLPQDEEPVDIEDTQLQAAIDYLLGKEVISQPSTTGMHGDGAPDAEHNTHLP